MALDAVCRLPDEHARPRVPVRPVVRYRTRAAGPRGLEVMMWGVAANPTSRNQWLEVEYRTLREQAAVLRCGSRRPCCVERTSDWRGRWPSWRRRTRNCDGSWGSYHGRASGKRHRSRGRVRKAERRRPGRAAGHDGASQAVPEHVDEDVRAPLVTCPCCGGDELDEIREHEQYVVDIPPVQQHVRRIVTERLLSALSQARAHEPPGPGLDRPRRCQGRARAACAGPGRRSQTSIWHGVSRHR